MTEVAIQTTPVGETARSWAPAVRQRRRALVQRLGMGAATAMVFSPLFGWTVSAVWAACYFAIQLVDLAVFAPINGGRNDRMGPGRTLAGAMVLFLNAAAFGSLSVVLWTAGGIMGGICASVVLASGAIYAVVNSPRSAQVLALTIAPQFIYLAMTPLFMMINGAQPTFVTAAAISIVFFAAYCVSTWRSLNEAYEAEGRSRIAAERGRAEAERVMTSRSAFLAAIGHDLRTPIGAILTGAGEMDRAATDASARAHAALITDAGLLMKALLDDLLDHSKLDAGRMTVEAADFNLRALLAQTLRLWQGPVRAKGLSLRVEGVREIPAMVRGDAMRVRQVLNNLLSNALKFTDEGAVTLRLRSWGEEPSGHAILFEVSDTGPGMTPDQLSRLFTPFDQTADGVSARHGGTGLGLAISRDLAELMGGRLTARSMPGHGARFTLSLVLGTAVNEAATVAALGVEDRADVARALMLRAAAADAPRPAVAAPVIEPAMTDIQGDGTSDDEDGERPLRVLIVDDHDINRRAVELILAPLGCDIASAADGLAALKLCETGVFDVVFMDVRMPELDGRETTRRLRAGGGPNADVPVIAVTADTGRDDIAACMAAGMTYFVSKPLTPAALLGALSQVLSGADEEAGAEIVAA